MFSVGITAWQDAAVGALFGQPDSLPVYLQAQASGQLRARVVGAQWWDRDRGAEQVAELVARRRRPRPRGLPGHLGQGDAGRRRRELHRRAAVVVPRRAAAPRPATAASASSTRSRCGSTSPTLDAARLPGARARAGRPRGPRGPGRGRGRARRANGPDGGRHHLAHLQVVSPDDIPRFAELGRAATMQPLWAAHEPQMDDLTIPFLGDERAELQYPFADLVAAGAHLAGGSDWPVSSPDPLLGAHVAVNRVAPRRDRRRRPSRCRRATGSTSAPMLHRVHRGQRLGERSRGRRPGGWRRACSPTSRCSTATRSPARRRRSPTARVVATYLAGELVFRGRPA